MSKHDADLPQRIGVITGSRRESDWKEAQKARILAESAEPKVNISELSRRNEVDRRLLNVRRRKAWRTPPLLRLAAHNVYPCEHENMRSDLISAQLPACHDLRIGI